MELEVGWVFEVWVLLVGVIYEAECLDCLPDKVLITLSCVHSSFCQLSLLECSLEQHRAAQGPI